MGVYNVHVHVKLYMCACRYKSICITIMGVMCACRYTSIHVYVHVCVIMGVYNIHVHSDVETASHA